MPPLGNLSAGGGHRAAQAVVPLQGDSGTYEHGDTTGLYGTARPCWDLQGLYLLGGPLEQPLSTSEIFFQGLFRVLLNSAPLCWLPLNLDKAQPKKKPHMLCPDLFRGPRGHYRSE